MPSASRLRLALAVAVLLCSLGAGTALVAASAPTDVAAVSATLSDAAGQDVGTIELRNGPRDAIRVVVKAHGLPAGFHGMHVHSIGACTAPTFASAGGHLKDPGVSHGDHAGDLPSLYVKRDGTASARFETDRFGLDALRALDGSAVVIHAGPDNFANIPARYAPDGPDQVTRDTGDSGPRLACGAIR